MIVILVKKLSYSRKVGGTDKNIKNMILDTVIEGYKDEKAFGKLS